MLRDLGLLEMTRQHSPYSATRYQLTFPAGGLGSLPMRTDVDGYPVIQGPKKAGRGGAPHHKRKQTGTPVPVSGDADRNSSSGDGESNQNPSSGEAAPAETHTGTGVPITERSPELEFQHTGTGVPPHRNWSSPDQTNQTKTNPVVTTTPPPTSAQQDHEQSANQPPNPRRTGTPLPDFETAYRDARRIVDPAPQATRENALAQAAAELRERGIVDIKQRTIRAATIITRLRDDPDWPPPEVEP